MEIYYSRETFGFAMVVVGSTRRPTTINKLAVIYLKRIMTPSFISLDMFTLVVSFPPPPCFICNNDDFLGYQLAAITLLVSKLLYKRYDMSLKTISLFLLRR